MPWNDTNHFEKKRKLPCFSENMIIFLRRNYPHQVPEFGARLPSQPFGSPDYIFDTEIIHLKKQKVKSIFEKKNSRTP